MKLFRKLSPLLIPLLFSCSHGEKKVDKKKEPTIQYEQIIVEEVPVLLLHRMREHEEKFKNPLAKRFNMRPIVFSDFLHALYQLGFSLVDWQGLESGRFLVPKGRYPLILTFDDGDISNFKVRKDGTIVPECTAFELFVFSTVHPEFGRKAIFFLNASFFGQREYEEAKLKWLKEHGFEIGSHGWNHLNCIKIDKETVLEEFARVAEKARRMGMKMECLAYPYGVPPKKEVRILLRNGYEYHGENYSFKIGFIVGHMRFAKTGICKGFDPMLVERLDVSDDDFEWIIPLLKKYKKEVNAVRIPVPFKK